MRMRTRAGLRAGDGAAAAGGDFTSGRVCEWRAGLDANFSLTGVDIDTVKVLNNGDTDLDIIYVGGGGYTTKAQHDADNPIDITKTIDIVGAGDYQLRAAGLLSDMVPVDGSDFGFLVIVKVDSIVNAFGSTKDILVRLANGVEISFYNGASPKVFVSMDNVPSTAEAAITLGQWLIIRVNHDANKATVTVGDGAEVVAGASTSGALTDGRVRFFADTGTGGYMDGAVFLIRPYSAKITNLQWSQLKSYWRGQFADIA